MYSIQELLSQGKHILAVGAHWDDIELGCGLALSKLAKLGCELHGAVLTDSAYVSPLASRIHTDAAAEGSKAFLYLGIFSVNIEKRTTQELTYNTDQMKTLESLILRLKVALAFIPWPSDFNTDHAAAAKISRVASRYVPSVLYYQSNGYYDSQRPFAPNLFIGGSSMEYYQKDQVLKIHHTEYVQRKERWQREIIDRDHYWGSLCGCDYAEGFVVSRMRLL